MSSLPPAGWYPNPSGAPGQRYFDGRGVDGPPSRRPATARGPARTAAVTHADQRCGHRTQPRTARRTDAADLLGLRWLGMDMADRRRE